MADYASMKVPELKKLLAERKLAQTGNKADLIARLQEEDSKPVGDGETKPAGKDDEITYSDDEGAKPAAVAAPAAPAAAPEAAAPAADAAPKDTATEAAQPAEGEAAAAAEEPAVPAPSFAMGLSSSTADEEAKKRADRAKRFGIEEENDDDAKKLTDRAKRFGLEVKDVSGLDSALPERTLKRGRGQNQDGQRPGKRQSTDRRGGDRRNGRNDRNDRNDRNGRQGGGGGGRSGNAPAKGAGIFSDPAEKAKAEKRAARFAAA